MDNRELWLAATLVELADSPDADFGETTYSDRLALRLAQLLAPAEVGVLIGDASALKAAAGSTERAHRLVSFEAGHGEGPGTSCYNSGQQVLNESLTVAGGRWPRFAAAARAAGFGIVSSLPIRRHHETAGVINVLGTGEHPLERDGDQPGPDPGRGGSHRRPAAAGTPSQHPDYRAASARARQAGAHRASQRGRRRTARHHAGGGVRAAARLRSPAQPLCWPRWRAKRSAGSCRRTN